MQSLIFKSPTAHSNNSLCYDFQDIAVKTWNLLGNAYNNDFAIGEETITDINLLELKMRQPNLVYTKKFSRNAEGVNGADWVWIIVGRNGNTFMLYVQAKKLFLPSLRYKSLLHAAPNPTEQLDKLILNKFFYPIGLPIYPIYVFYNYLPNHNPLIPCNCGRNLSVELAGCSYADAFSIRNEMLANHNRFSDYVQYQYAWSCLVCCDGGNSKNIPNVDLATTYFNRIVNQAKFNDTEAVKIKVKDNKPFSAESFLLKQPPSFVSQIISGKELEYNPFKELGVENITVLQELENNNTIF